ncbi:Pre-mRNA-splicing factor prp46 [Hortaea werneckii EXF-2000]|uniref:Pre-mRNA-splicing factor PRP46 n=1 Tax=Hortaea werneckii EXF-2000 TaxID=1157616 RepID=A0A1Z5SLR6_HORWE|nr:Pre-mRNA-splicing factor prp46 [Hortaea werneckii EXF-2000]
MLCSPAATTASVGFWDWKTGHRFQYEDSVAQPGSLDAEAGIMSSTFDLTGLRLITGEADKTIKLWRPDENATEETHPLQWAPTFGQEQVLEIFLAKVSFVG